MTDAVDGLRLRLAAAAGEGRERFDVDVPVKVGFGNGEVPPRPNQGARDAFVNEAVRAYNEAVSRLLDNIDIELVGQLNVALISGDEPCGPVELGRWHARLAYASAVKERQQDELTEIVRKADEILWSEDA